MLKIFSRVFSIVLFLSFLVVNLINTDFVGINNVDALVSEGDLGVSFDSNPSYGTSLEAWLHNGAYSGSLPIDADLGIYHCNGSQGDYCGGDSGDFDRAVHKPVSLNFPAAGGADVQTTFSGLPSASDFGGCGRVQVDVGNSMGVFGGRTLSLGGDCQQAPVCPNMSCDYSENVSTSECPSGIKITTGTGASGFNQPGCTFVDRCSQSRCEPVQQVPQPAAPEAQTPAAQTPAAPASTPDKKRCFICDNGDWRPSGGWENPILMVETECNREQNSWFNHPEKPDWCRVSSDESPAQLASPAPVQSAAPAVSPRPSASPSPSPSASVSPSPSASAAPQGGVTITNNNTNTQTQSVNVTQGNVGVGRQAAASSATSLPKTGLPALAWITAAFLPAGLKMKKFGKNIDTDESNPNYLWEDREFKRS